MSEADDLATLLEAQKTLKLTCFDFLRTLDAASERELQTFGFGGKTNAEAMQLGFRMYLRDIAKLNDAHLKKYPD